MQPSATELEQIVRVVMQRLAAGRDLMAGVAEMAEVTAEPTELAICDRVISTSLIENRLDGKRTLRVGARAIVTPAVTDLLRAKKIDLIRAAHQPTGATTARALTFAKTVGAKSVDGSKRTEAAIHTTASRGPILVCGSAVWFNSLVRHLCSEQAVVHACDDSTALPAVEQHLELGGQRAVWLSNTPFAAAVSAQRVTSAALVQLPSLAELPAAIQQAQPKIFVVDASRWTVAAIGNLVRALARLH